MLCALICGCLDGLTILGVPGVGAIRALLPLSDMWFGWVVPSIIGFIVGWVKYKLVPEKAAEA